MEPEYNTTFVQASQPPVDLTGNRPCINYSFSVQEVAYIGFIVSRLNASLNQGATFAFLGASEKMQKDFTQFVEIKFGAKRTFTVAELELNSIITSIFEKTKLYVKNTLVFNNEGHLIENENAQLVTADHAEKVQFKEHPGKVITERQARLLITFATKI